jgi:DNA ligase-1
MKTLRRPMRFVAIDNEEQLEKLTYPLIVMPKFDGIRCLLHGGRVLSRTLKPIPNSFIVEQLREHANYAGDGLFDGEIVLTDTKDYNKVQSAVMSADGAPLNFRFVCFDRVINSHTVAGVTATYWHMDYHMRLGWLDTFYTQTITSPYFIRAGYYIVHNHLELLKLEEQFIKMGYEGIIIRALHAPYKQGKTTMREGYGWKFKRVEDAEAEIIRPVELEHNMNDAETNELGLTKRSSHQINKIGAGLLGAFEVEGINGRYKGKRFSVSCGTMTKGEKEMYWHARHHLKSIITYTYAKHRGTEDAPAEPRFKCFRED